MFLIVKGCAVSKIIYPGCVVTKPSVTVGPKPLLALKGALNVVIVSSFIVFSFIVVVCS